MLTFDPIEHRYYWNGKAVPNVTSIIEPYLTDYWRIPAQILRDAQARGTAVHIATDLYDQGVLDWKSVHPIVEPYLMGWVKFRREVPFQIRRSEHRMYSVRFGFAGTLDRSGPCGPEEWLLDIKTSEHLMPSVGPQVAAYDQLLDEEERAQAVAAGAAIMPRQRGRVRKCVQLRDNGLYKIHTLADQSDFGTFLACLTVYRFGGKHGIEHNRLSSDQRIPA